jgi:hypothetical protein
MPTNFLATEPHFLEHLAPTFKAVNGARFYVANELLVRAEELGVQALPLQARQDTNITVVAAFGDLKKARANGARVILSEHGAGQSYQGVQSGSYIGGADRRGVIAVLVPGANQANRHRLAHPMIPAYEVGVPKLDYLHRNLDKANAGIDREKVLISFHWDCKVAPETRSAFRFYKPIIRQMKDDFKITIHGHPRASKEHRAFAEHFKLDYIESFAEAIESNWIYCCDNSSTIFEWASLQRPVVVLNSHLYRRNINHGMRFWEYADIGAQVDNPSAFPEILRRAMDNDAAYRPRREAIVAELYQATDGQAARRAAQAIEQAIQGFGAQSKE